MIWVALGAVACTRLGFDATASRSDGAADARDFTRADIAAEDAADSGVSDVTWSVDSALDAARDATPEAAGPSDAGFADLRWGDAYLCSGGPTLFTTNMSARRVLGQADFVASSANRGGVAGAATMSKPLGLVVYGSKLLVADTENNRILVLDADPALDGAAATDLIGQPDFVSTDRTTSASTVSGPQGLFLSGDSLLVAEWGSARAGVWPLATLLASPSVSHVFGQVDATSAEVVTANVTASTLGPVGSIVALGGRYAVTDSRNHRVLLFETLAGQPPAASVAIGQAGLTTNDWGPLPTQTDFPLGLATDGTRLAVVDTYNNRLLLFEQAPTTSGAVPDLIWGGYGVSASKLNNPVGAFTDGTRLFVADRGNDRVLIFDSWPTSVDQPADVVLGQANFTSGDNNQGNGSVAAANTLSGAHHVYFDGCRLFVSDSNNNRVLIY